MGSNERWDDESPEHINQTGAFYIDLYEVTNRDYKKFVGVTKRKSPHHWAQGNIPKDKENHPVTYVSWFEKNMITKGDNPPIGILLCTDKNHTLAEYALAGMDNQLFVSKYMLQLPKKDDMERFIEEKIKEIGP